MQTILKEYPGFRTVTDNELAMHYENEKSNVLNLNPNEFVMSSEQELMKFKQGKLKLAEKRSLQSNFMGKTKAMNVEQEMSLELLLDRDIPCVVLTGAAGCGKTFLAAHAGFYQVEKQYYEKVFFTRNHVEVGKPLGALPGDIFEKIKPYCASIVDQCGGWDVIFRLAEQKEIEMEAISFLQGRDLKKCFIIVDEAQNVNIDQIKMLITRVGEGSKIVLCGDLQQIASKEFQNGNNGLQHLIDKFLEAKTDLFGVVELQESVRSPLAKLAAELL